MWPTPLLVLSIGAFLNAPPVSRLTLLLSDSAQRGGAPVCALVDDAMRPAAQRTALSESRRSSAASAAASAADADGLTVAAPRWIETLRRGAVGALAAAMLLAGDASAPAFAENELAALADGQFKSELVQPECFATSCKQQTEACAANGDCTKGLACTAKCMGDAQCTVGCFARYGNAVLDDVLSCTIEDAGCIKIATQAPGADSPYDAPRPPKALVRATPATMSGKWYKVLGWNPNYDCFDCQRNSFGQQAAGSSAKLASNVGGGATTGGSPMGRGREVSIDVKGESVDVEVEYAMPRIRLDQPATTFSSTLHEKLVFDSAPGSRRTAHTEGKMFGLTFWENWYVIGENRLSEPQFRFVYYTGKTLQNRYEGAFVYSRTPELPRDALPSIYRIAREAGMDPTRFCCVDNKCFERQPGAAQPPPFTPIAEAADSMPAGAGAAPSDSLLQKLPASLRKMAVDVSEYLEDPTPAGRAIFGNQRQMYQVREFDANGYRVPLESIR